MNGLHTNTERQQNFNKWTEINATMRDEKIAILAVQETHLDGQNTLAIHEALGKRLLILNSQPEDNPRSSAGVAFILNKDLVDTKQVKQFELIKGRAIAIKLTWKNNEETVLINVYAPNKKKENQLFWEKTNEERINSRLRAPDFVLGDFNITEDPIDRIPAKHDNTGAVNALRDFRLNLGIQDQWRHAYPKAREYTYRAMHNEKPIKSRLDRIYVAKSKANFTFDWKIGRAHV